VTRKRRVLSVEGKFEVTEKQVMEPTLVVGFNL
jgi:hypothetical protein